jgi:hypothetical protein
MHLAKTLLLGAFLLVLKGSVFGLGMQTAARI